MTTTQIIARQGWLGALILLAIFLFSVWFDWNVCSFISFVLLAIWLVMFRNPERIPSVAERNVFVSPVDGIVRDITSSKEEVSVLIETSFLDVGMIRSPCDIIDGKCEEKKGLSITYCSKEKRAQLNAAIYFTSLQNRMFSIEFRPVFFSSQHLFTCSNLSIGERMGFMKVGTTRIVFPRKTTKNNIAEIELKVNIGDNLKASQSVIGYFDEV